jgi:L-lactate dehydrogenase
MTIVAIAAARAFAQELLAAAGLEAQLALSVADELVEADLLGHRTHGLALLVPYLQQIESGGMARAGTHRVLSDSPAAFHWAADRLPGAHVLRLAIAELVERAATHPVVTASIAECFHIGALQIYLEAATRADLICLIATTDPAVRSVAPFGGIDPVLTSNPLACGIPTRGDPILIDICTSTVSNAGAAAYGRRGEMLPGEWLLDNTGRPSADPAVMRSMPPGTLLPLGGADLGYKGFGLGIMVEALALALSGYGRNNAGSSFGESVFVQVINPAHFAGRDIFLDEMQALVDKSHASRPVREGAPVRLPGEGALHRRRVAEAAGLDVPPEIFDALRPWTERFGVSI